MVYVIVIMLKLL